MNQQTKRNKRQRTSSVRNATDIHNNCISTNNNNTDNDQNPLRKLPQDVLQEILSYLTPENLLTVGLVDRYMYNLSNSSPSVWQMSIMQHKPWLCYDQALKVAANNSSWRAVVLNELNFGQRILDYRYGETLLDPYEDPSFEEDMSGIKCVAVHTSGTVLVSLSEDVIRFWDFNSGKFISQLSIPLKNDTLEKIAFDPWDEDALYGWGGEWIVQWSFSQKKQVRKISLKSKEPRFVVYSLDISKKLLAVLNSLGSDMFVLSKETGEIVLSIPTGFRFIGREMLVHISEEKNLILVQHCLFDLTTGIIIRTVRAGDHRDSPWIPAALGVNYRQDLVFLPWHQKEGFNIETYRIAPDQCTQVAKHSIHLTSPLHIRLLMHAHSSKAVTIDFSNRCHIIDTDTFAGYTLPNVPHVHEKGAPTCVALWGHKLIFGYRDNSIGIFDFAAAEPRYNKRSRSAKGRNK